MISEIILKVIYIKHFTYVIILKPAVKVKTLENQTKIGNSIIIHIHYVSAIKFYQKYYILSYF